MKTSMIALAIAASLSLPAIAQTGGTSGGQRGQQEGPAGARGGNLDTRPPTTMGTPGMVPGAAGTAAPSATAGMAAQQFPMEAMHSDTFEIQSSRTALQRSRNSEVRTYARQMITDHGRSTAMLRQMAGETTASTGTASRNARIDPRRAQMLQQLRGQRGAAFDRLYAQMQVQAHQEAVQLFTAYAQSGSDPTMRNFATQNLPTLQQHLANAQRLEQAVARSANNRS